MKKILPIIIALVTLTGCYSANKNLTEEELSQGWYYGEQEEKKEGTPEDWVWINGSDNPKWIAPVTEMMDF